MTKYIIGLVLIAVLIGGVYTMNQGSKEAGGTSEVASDAGTYPYTCDNGATFTMTPSTEVPTLAITPGANAPFQATVLTTVESAAGARFEGGGIVFVGVGEEVRLTYAGATMVCNPVPNPEMAPWNWGDAGEGGGEKQDVTMIVSESIVGKWKSVDDATFVREFKADGKVVDSSSGKEVSTGSYVVFSKDKPVSVSFPSVRAN